MNVQLKVPKHLTYCTAEQWALRAVTYGVRSVSKFSNAHRGIYKFIMRYGLCNIYIYVNYSIHVNIFGCTKISHILLKSKKDPHINQ